ncbi:MAG: hypothetical protein JWM91_4456 [Rhodospirillales bacterium]|nr:hypothetical protein [Rhodospirillales bacterium]
MPDDGEMDTIAAAIVARKSQRTAKLERAVIPVARCFLILLLYA